MFTDILAAVSPVDACRPAMEVATELAARSRAKLEVLHVWGFGDPNRMTLGDRPVPASRDLARTRLEAFCSQSVQGVPECRLALEEGFPHVEILKAARRVNADLIVLGGHVGGCPHTDGQLWGLAGSCMEKVGGLAPCPVMIVPGPARDILARPCILAASDLSHASDCAVEYAAQVAASTRSMLAVLHVLPASDGVDRPRDASRNAGDARTRMSERFTPRFSGVGSFCFETVEGTAAVGILEFARAWGAGMIVMGRKGGETDPERAFQASTTMHVVAEASCPVVSVNRRFVLRCSQTA